MSKTDKKDYDEIVKYKKDLDEVFYGMGFLARSFYKFTNKLDELGYNNIPYDVIKAYYDNQTITQVFKPNNEIHEYHPILSFYAFEKVYIDTMYLTQKNSVLAIVNIMDLFSKYAFSKCFVIPARTSNISSEKTMNVFKEFLNTIKNEVVYVNSDRGNEYKGNFHKYLEEKKIIQVYSNVGDHHAQSPIERFNRTLRLMIEKYRVLKNKIDNNAIQKIIDTYNNTIHSKFTHTPNQILNNQLYQTQLSGYYEELKKEYNEEIIKPLEGYVRILLETSSFQKIKPIWSLEIYKIKSFNNGFYELENSKKLYKREELQPVEKDFLMRKNIKIEDDEEPIKKVLRSTDKEGIKTRSQKS